MCIRDSLKGNRCSIRIDKIQNHIRRRKRRVAAQIDFSPRSKPTKMIGFCVRNHKSSFGQVVFLCDFLHLRVRKPALQHADCRRIPAEYSVGKGVCHILFHAFSFTTQSGLSPRSIRCTFSHICRCIRLKPVSYTHLDVYKRQPL